MTEVRARSWESTTSLPRAGRSIKAAGLWAALMVTASLLASVGASSLSPLSKTDPALAGVVASHPKSTISVIVRKTNPASLDAERRVRTLGGRVTGELPIISSFAARLPASELKDLVDSTSVLRVWGNAHLHATGVDMSQYDNYSPNTSWQQTIQSSGNSAPQSGPLLQTSMDRGPSVGSSLGQGVTVALLDTGVSQVPDLGNRVLVRVDLTPDHDGYDRYGHGTHMAGIIAGDGTSSNGQWVGIAPKANLVSVKVARADGSTDVSVVIAAMQWIVSHKAQYNIRVLNLSYGTDSRQSYAVDPLDYAVEQVWRSGIFVAVAAGNTGPDAGTVTKPGDDPFVLTVGAANTRNTAAHEDDEVAPFSARGPTQDGLNKPDLVAPSISIVSNRAAGSTLDQLHPAARVGDYYFKGTGTSQATAIASGVAANLFATAPALTPDLAKAILLRTADHGESGPGAGAGMIDSGAALTLVRRSYWWVTPANQGVTPSSGLGSIEATRGSYHVNADFNNDGQPDLIQGEIDVLGNAWSPAALVGKFWSANSWSGNSWSSYVFEGNSWSGNSWSGNSWSGTSWCGNSWSGNSWS
jgi:serine protease AprX